MPTEYPDDWPVTACAAIDGAEERVERAEARVAELEAAICRHVRAREGESGERPDMTVAVLYRIEHAIKARDAKAPGPSVSDARRMCMKHFDVPAVAVIDACVDCHNAWRGYTRDHRPSDAKCLCFDNQSTCPIHEVGKRTNEALPAQDEDCKVRPCACPCHTDVEEPGPHLLTCAWAKASYEPTNEATHTCIGAGSTLMCLACSQNFAATGHRFVPKAWGEHVREGTPSIRVDLLDDVCTWLAASGHKVAADLLHESRNRFICAPDQDLDNPLVKVCEVCDEEAAAVCKARQRQHIEEAIDHCSDDKGRVHCLGCVRSPGAAKCAGAPCTDYAKVVRHIIEREIREWDEAGQDYVVRALEVLLGKLDEVREA